MVLFQMIIMVESTDMIWVGRDVCGVLCGLNGTESGVRVVVMPCGLDHIPRWQIMQISEERRELKCKGTCETKYGGKIREGGNGQTKMYQGGFKRCKTCECWLKWEGLFCPCCGVKLRSQPYNMKGKRRLRELKKCTT